MKRIILTIGLLCLFSSPASAAWDFANHTTANSQPTGMVQQQNWSCTTWVVDSDTTLSFPATGDTWGQGAVSWVIGGIMVYDNHATADSSLSVAIVDSGSIVDQPDTIYFGGEVVFQGWTPIEVNFGDGGMSFPAGDSVAIRVSPGAGVTGRVNVRWKQRDF